MKRTLSYTKDIYLRGDEPHSIVLYGGGMYAEFAYDVLRHIWNAADSVLCIADRKLKELEWANKKIVTPNEIISYKDADILICGASSFGDIYGFLSGQGCKHVYDISELLKEFKKAYEEKALDYTGGYLYGALDLQEILLRYDYHAGCENGYDKMLYLPYCVLCITTRCTLRCKECAAFINDYKEKKDYSLEYVKKVFGKFLDSIDGIMELELMGGEPLLSVHFNEILEWCCEQEKIKAIKIVTNSTIMPKDSTMQLLKDHKVKLVLDDYGALSYNLSNLIKAAKENGIRYELQKLATWYQMWPIEKQEIDDESLKAIWAHCNFRTCMGVTDGKFYHCNVAGHMNTLKMIPEKTDEFVDLEKNNLSKEELRKRISELLQIEYLEACRYCNMCRKVTVPVTKQKEI